MKARKIATSVIILLLCMMTNTSCIRETFDSPNPIDIGWRMYYTAFYDIETSSDGFMLCYRSWLILHETDKEEQQKLIKSFFPGYAKVEVAKESLTLTINFQLTENESQQIVVKSDGNDFTTPGACWSIATSKYILSFTRDNEKELWHSELLNQNSLKAACNLTMDLKTSQERGNHLYVGGYGSINMDKSVIKYNIDTPIGRDYGRVSPDGYNFQGAITMDGDSQYPLKASIAENGAVTCSYSGETDSSRYYY